MFAIKYSITALEFRDDQMHVNVHIFLLIECVHYFHVLYVAKSLSLNPLVFVTLSPKRPTIFWM